MRCLFKLQNESFSLRLEIWKEKVAWFWFGHPQNLCMPWCRKCIHSPLPSLTPLTFRGVTLVIYLFISINNYQALTTTLGISAHKTKMLALGSLYSSGGRRVINKSNAYYKVMSVVEPNRQRERIEGVALWMGRESCNVNKVVPEGSILPDLNKWESEPLSLRIWKKRYQTDQFWGRNTACLKTSEGRAYVRESNRRCS